MIPLGSSRRSHVYLAIVLLLALVLFLHAHPHPQSYFLSGPISKLKVQFGLYNASDGLEKKDKRIRERVERMKGYCEAEDAFEREYGRTNLRLARGYEGKSILLTVIITNILQALMKECAYCFKRSCEVNSSLSLLLVVVVSFSNACMDNSLIVSAVTKGHQVWENEIWFHKFWEWLTEFAGEDVEIKEVNGAAPGKHSSSVLGNVHR